MRTTAALLVALLTTALAASAAEIERTPARDGRADLVATGNLVFLSGVFGTDPEPARQVEEVIERAHALLAERGLGIGNMLQHTIFLKDGAVSPMEVLGRFHATATRLAPSLKTHPSVGTIIRVPELAAPGAAVMLDMVAGAPLGKEGTEGDGYHRIPFTFGPQEIAETIADEVHLFTAGTEAMDFEHGTLPQTIDAQIAAVMDKLQAGVKKAGLDLHQMLQHNIYITHGNDPMHVLGKFHEEMRKRDPRAKEFLGTGSLFVVDGMAGNGFLIEIDAVFTRKAADQVKRVPFTEMPIDVVKTAATESLVFVTSMPGADLGAEAKPAAGIDAQIEKAVRNVAQALEAAGVPLANLVKHRLALHKSVDVARARARYREVITRLAPELGNHPDAETILLVEALESEGGLCELSVIAAR